MPTNSDLLKTITEQLETIQKSPVHNGEFHQLCSTVEHIKEKQDEMGEKLETIHNSLFLDGGVYTRINKIEEDLTQTNELLQNHQDVDNKFFSSLAKTHNDLKQSIEPVLTTKNYASKGITIILTAILSGLGAIILEWFIKR